MRDRSLVSRWLEEHWWYSECLWRKKKSFFQFKGLNSSYWDWWPRKLFISMYCNFDSFVAYHLHCLGPYSIRNSLKSTMQTIEGENAPMVLDSCSSKSMSETCTAQRFHLGNYGNAGRHRSNQLLSNRIWEPVYQKKFMCSSLNLIVVPNFLCH